MATINLLRSMRIFAKIDFEIKVNLPCDLKRTDGFLTENTSDSFIGPKLLSIFRYSLKVLFHSGSRKCRQQKFYELDRI